MQKHPLVQCLVMSAILVCGTVMPARGQTELGSRVIASGGTTTISASHVLKATLGQTITGKTTGSSYFSGLGFWEQIEFDNATGLPETPPVLDTRLHQNVPNPFNPSTTIHFSLAGEELVRLDLFDLQGRRVARLLNEPLPAGAHALEFRPRDLASGIYLLRLSAGSHHESRRLVLLK